MAVVVDTYNQLFDLIGEGVITEADTFRAILLNNSHAFNAAHVAYADVSANELATGNGYTATGVALTGFSLLNGSPGSPWNIDFDDLDPGWTATGGSIGPYRYMVIYDATADRLLFSIDFDDGGGTFTAADGADINVNVPVAGLATVTAA